MHRLGIVPQRLLRESLRVTRHMAQKPLATRQRRLASPEHMKTKIPRIFITATILVWTVLLWGCASSRVGQVPQNESHENISPVQKEAVLKALDCMQAGIFISSRISPQQVSQCEASLLLSQQMMRCWRW